MKKEKIKNVKEKIKKKSLDKEMQESYLDYAMSVIVSRALPDIRDGLKPVQRRILYTMWKIGLDSKARFKKSAAVVGETMGKYHPHGDMAIYDALVRMVQDFSINYPLIDGQGNFGSLDNDPPAAQRYTEVRLSSLGEEMLYDLERETVDFIPNYDGTSKEPIILPARIPLLLLNGASGIAVGVAANIPSHNLSEICEALIYLIDYPETTLKDLLKIIKGPDFPTGGLILGNQSFEEIYSSGKGSILIRAKTEIIEKKKEEKQIVITEIPYQVSKNIILEKIVELIKEKKIEEIKDIKDLSDKEGIRIVIDLKKQVLPEKVLNRLFAFSPLQETFYFNFVALGPGLEVKTFSLIEILRNYLEHRKIVIKRRTEFELKRVEERLHILEGFKIALAKIDLVINLIKKSKDKEKAKIALEGKFKLSEKQALAILEMRLYQLAHLEREKIEKEFSQKKKEKDELKEILLKPKKIFDLIKKDLQEIKEKYGRPRKTEIVSYSPREFKEEDILTDEPTMILMTKNGYVKRISPEIFRSQARGGKGTFALKTRDGDFLTLSVLSSTLSALLFFTNKGKAFSLKTYEISESSKLAKGEAIVNFLNLAPEEKISTILPITKKEGGRYLIMVTKNGLIKKVGLNEFLSVKKRGLVALNLEKDDLLRGAKLFKNEEEIILVTTLGQLIRFKEKELRQLSRGARGVRGIKLKNSDEVIGLDLSSKENKLIKILTISQFGFGKKTSLSSYRVQKRGGSGIKTAKISSKTGQLVKFLLVEEKKEEEKYLIINSSSGQALKISLKDISLLGRASQGVRLIKFKEKDDQVASVILI